MANQEELKLVETITCLYNSISKLPSLDFSSTEVNQLFKQLLHTCIPHSSIEISTLPKETQVIRANLIKLRGKAIGLLESHYSTIISNQENPLESLTLFPYLSNYERLTQLEFDLLSRHVTSSPSLVAFIGSGPLPLTSIILATRYLTTDTVFHNYDLDSDANAMARKLVESDPDLRERVVFRTSDVMQVKQALSGYDVIFLASLVGIERKEKKGVIQHLAHHMKPGALLLTRTVRGARAFLYPVVDMEDLDGFDVLSVYHPEDDRMINSVILARKNGVVVSCKCCEPLVNNPCHGSLVEELTDAGQHSSRLN